MAVLGPNSRTEITKKLLLIAIRIPLDHDTTKRDPIAEASRVGAGPNP